MQRKVKEAEIQDFFEEYPYLLPGIGILHHGPFEGVVATKFQLGNSYETDFAFIASTSQTLHISCVEIESPRKPLFRKDGAFSRDYLDAKQQITDWLFWAHHNVRQALDCWGYLLNGSEFLAAIANRLNAADKLIGYGKPVIVECLISREQLDFSFWKSIAAREIEEVLNKILFPNAEYKRRVSSGFHISTVIPPERLKFHFPNELVVQTEYFDFNTNQIHRVMERKLCFNQKVAA
ncbi:MAG: Shedu anti-phage system protein SduA domain-containing protein [Limisphaerales bacterium]